jgi:hypothetical protein
MGELKGDKNGVWVVVFVGQAAWNFTSCGSEAFATFSYSQFFG